MPGTKNKQAKQFRIGRGSLGGQFVACHPSPDLRPTLTRVREAVFSMLAKYASSHGFLDGCAGSGIMAIEAASMGFQPIVCFEVHQPSLRQIKANFKRLDRSATFFQKSILELPWLKVPAKPWILYSDPPYRQSEIHEKLLQLLATCPTLVPGSIYIAESEDGTPSDIPKEWNTWKRRKYGRTHLWFGVKQP